MKTVTRKVVLYLLPLTSFLFSVTLLPGQPLQFRFQHLTNEHGLPQNTVYGACQDRYGFMWFSTKNGVCRYDGYGTKIFKPTDYFSEDVVDLSQCIVQDVSGLICFGTGYGFYMIDIERDSIIRRISFDSIDSTDSYLNNVFCIHPDDKLLWIGTGNGLVRYDKITGALKWFSGKELVPGLKAQRCWIKAIEKDNSGNLWLATSAGLIQFHKKLCTSQVYNQEQQGRFFINNSYFSSLAYDKKGRLWAGTLRKGVYCFDFNAGTIDSIDFTGLPDTAQEFNEVKRLCCDSRGFIWAGTQYTGLVRINPADNNFQRIRSSNLNGHALSSDLISALYEDRNGILWAGTYNSGVDRTSITGSPFINIPFTTADSTCFAIRAVECFAEQDMDNIWVGTMKGLFLFNKSTHACRTFEEVTGNKFRLPHFSIAGLLIDNDSNLWIGTRSNTIVLLNLHDQTLFSLKPDTTDPKLKKVNSFLTFIKSTSGEIYVSYDNRIMKYNSASKKLEALTDADNRLDKVRRVDRISEDSDNNLYFTSDFSSFHQFNIPGGKLTKLVAPGAYRDQLSQMVLVRQRAGGDYFLTDYKGLYLLDRNLNFKKHYTDKDGLCDNKINNCMIDKSGKLWMSTFNGLSVFNPSDSTFQNFYTQDGLAENEFRESKSLQAADGTIFLPTNKGFTYFNPEQIKPHAKSSGIFFTVFKIFEKEIKFGRNLNQITDIHIPAGRNFFSVAFASSSFNTLRPNSYLFRLEGVDNEWITSTANVANYTNLDGGDYLFRVRSGNDAETERALHIHVGTVFYKTWWFRALLFLSLGLMIALLIRMRESKLKEKEAEKTIDYFANSYYGKNTVDEILWDVCRNCISRLGFEDAVVYLLDEKRNILVQKAAYGPKNRKDFEIEHPLEIPVGQGIVGSVASSGQPEIIPGTTKDPRYIADDASRLSEISVPLIYENKVIGVIDSEHSRKNFFNRDHLRILSTIASICSTKIAKAQSDLEKIERERLLLEIGKKVAETRLMALRSQMNPHFIFNSLNAIQDCIVNAKIEDAQVYLSSFSKLLRMVIDYSELNFISLEKEIGFLTLYLQLESLRFGNSFYFEIEVDDMLDREETMIPSLLVQPFVENAIWHGLLHKKEERKLFISFSQNGQDHLVFRVTDNGIGRRKAEEMKSGKINGINHQSKGMRISQERIDLVKLQSHINPEIMIEDLEDGNGNATGTRVTVTLPLEVEHLIRQE